MALSRRLRFEILKRDNHTCRYCGAAAPEAALTVDHVVPVSLGGSDGPSNLVAACVDCNGGKASSHPDDEFVRQVEEDAFEWKRTVKDELRKKTKDYPAVLAAVEAFRVAWDDYKYTGTDDAVPRDHGWGRSVKTWLNMLTQGNLDDAEFVDVALGILLDLIPSAMKPGIKDRWRYYCGCAWNQVRQTQGSLNPPEPPEPVDPERSIRDELARRDVDEALARADRLFAAIGVEIHDEDGDIWCESCDDPYCEHAHAYRQRRTR